MLLIKKTLTGIGATTLELIADRSSIIVEPNLPVIFSKITALKEDEKGKYFGVFEDVTEFHIKKYLLNNKFTCKKIITTPESYTKVVNAMKSLNIDYHREYFLLFDECDKLSREVVFRDKILQPIDDFFKYKQKALISATAITPSDPQFRKHGFEYHIITPTYDYSKELDAYQTNNPKEMLREYIANKNKEDSEAQFFIFFNSVKGIVSCMEDLQIINESSLFTSESGKKSLSDSSHVKSIAHEFFNSKYICKYNFMTSRYFSALDIELILEKKPHIVMITDLNRANYTMLDPKSDMIQIPGRFRNGIASLTFICNSDSAIYCKTPEEVESYIVINIECYKQVVTFRNTCKDLVAKESFNSMLNHMPFRKYMKSDNELNYFMIDSFFEEERIKSYYKSYKNMNDCLDSMDNTFRVNYREINFLTKRKYYNSKHIKGLYEQIKEIVDDLDFILDNSQQTTFSLIDKESIYRSIEKNHPLILKAYRVIGRDRLLKDGYSLKNIELMIEESERIYATSNNKVLKHFKRYFRPGQKILQTQALTIFKNIIDSHRIPYSKKLKDLAEFVNFKYKKESKGTRYLLIESVKWS